MKMQDTSRRKKYVTKILVCLASLMFLLLTGCTEELVTGGEIQQTDSGGANVSAQSAKSDDDLYKEAVKDAMTIEDEEILPVISLEKGEPYATYNEEGSKILLITCHDMPEFYQEGKAITLKKDGAWIFTGGEMADWYAVEMKDLRDPGKRFRQLLGLAPDSSYTYYSAIWADREDILRPAYVTDIAETAMTDSFSGSVDAAYKDWFDDQIINSYFDGQRPWTRLGYTYDWSEGNGREYGLSEFYVKGGSQVDVEYTCTREEFEQKLKNGTWDVR